jgi:FtsH-binding integral membrane protein
MSASKVRNNANKEVRGFMLHVAPALGCVVAIFWLGSIHTALNIPQGLFAKDKANHFVAFGVLTLLCVRAFRFEYANLGNRRAVALSVAASSLVGALLEFWQAFLPYRTSELMDWVADTLGALLAGLAGYLWLRRRAWRLVKRDPAP